MRIFGKKVNRLQPLVTSTKSSILGLWKRTGCTATTHTHTQIQFRVSSVNVTKSTGNWGFGHIYWRNPKWKLHFLYSVWVNVFYLKIFETYQLSLQKIWSFFTEPIFSKCDQMSSFFLSRKLQFLCSICFELATQNSISKERYTSPPMYSIVGFLLWIFRHFP